MTCQRCDGKRLAAVGGNVGGKHGRIAELRPAKKNSLEAGAAKLLILKAINGRDGGIRTRDPLHPMQVRYQAALRPD